MIYYLGMLWYDSTWMTVEFWGRPQGVMDMLCMCL